MNSKDIFKSLNLIDDSLIESSEAAKSINNRKILKSFSAVAACIAIVAAVFVILSDFPEPSVTETTQQNLENITQIQLPVIYYNNSTEKISAAKRIDIMGAFPEELKENEIKQFVPDELLSVLAFSGKIYYNTDGKFYSISLSGKSSDNFTVYVQISRYALLKDYKLPENTLTVLGGKSAIFSCYTDNTVCHIEADFSAGGLFFDFAVSGNADEIASMKAIVENTAYHYAVSEKDYSAAAEKMIPEYIPEYKNVKLTEKGVYKDDDFGKYMPEIVPDGFSFESARRYKDYKTDYISSLWCAGLSTLRWQVRFLSENDKSRITSVEDKVNYDLSLYPIPRAESVPQELYEVVDDPIFSSEDLTLDAVKSRAYETEGDEGVKMMFSVLYGDILISIISNGISPEWIYDALMNIK